MVLDAPWGEGSDWDFERHKARTSLIYIQEVFADQFHSGADKDRWGQYLDPPPHREHTGVYGTSSGIIVSALRGSEYNEKIEAAQHWLISEWDNEESKTSQSGYRSILYKYAMCLLALSTEDLTLFGVGNTYGSNADTVSKFHDNLWDRRKDSGWGEFWTDDASTPSRLDATALALLALSDSDSIRNKDEYEIHLQNLSDRVISKAETTLRNDIGGDKYTALSTAFTLLALSRYRDLKDPDPIPEFVQESINSVAKVMEKQLRVHDGLNKQSYWINLVALPDTPDSLPIEKEHYILFPLYPIIATALLQAGDDYAARNATELIKISQAYTSEIDPEGKRCFTSENTQRCSTLDNLWVALALHSFVEAEPERASKFSKLKGRFGRRSVVKPLLWGIVFVGVIVSGYYNYSTNITWIKIISYISVLIFGAILRGLDPIQAVNNRISNLLQRLPG